MAYRHRRLRQPYQSRYGLWHIQVPQVTLEQAEAIKAAFKQAQRNGVVVTPPEIVIRRIR